MKKTLIFSIVMIVALLLLQMVIPANHHLITYALVPMIGSQDMRIAYANAYRSLWNKATNNGVNKNPTWLPNTGNKILSQSDLRSEIVLNQNKTTYQFGINVNQIVNSQTIFNTERRLNLQDTFYCAQIGYFFRILSTGSGNTQYASYLQTGVSANFYGGGINLDASTALWDGNLSMSINNRTVVPEWDLWRHYQRNTTQVPIYGTLLATQPIPGFDETDGAQSGMYPCEPMWILDGSYDNVLNVTYNNALAGIGLGTGALNIHMVVVMRGILAQNCGKIMEPGLMNPA